MKNTDNLYDDIRSTLMNIGDGKNDINEVSSKLEILINEKYINKEKNVWLDGFKCGFNSATESLLSANQIIQTK